MNVFVFYHDDYYEMGGVGFESFDSLGQAEGFIASRMANLKKPDCKGYRVVVGDELKVNAISYATKVELAR